MTTAWAHLPNARHIDAVLADVKARPEVWVVAHGAWGPAWVAAWDAAWDAARDAVRDAVRDAAWEAAWGSLIALIAWDDSASLLDQPPDVLRAMVDLADAPVCHQATLLLPYSIVRFGP